VSPAAEERSNGRDDDCDGRVEQYVGWSCGSAAGAPGLIGGLAGFALAGARRRRAARPAQG
jgi:MYXO-CTERM domain-containing protein